MAAKTTWQDPWTYVALALISPVFGWAVISLIGVDTLKQMDSSDWASWVQAIGAIGAILVSAAVVSWQVRRQHALQVEHERGRALKEELRLLEGFRDVATLGHSRLTAAYQLTDTRDSSISYEKVGRYINDFDLIGDALEAVDANAMTTASLVLAMRAARKTFRVALEHLDYVLHWASSDDEVGRLESRTRLQLSLTVLATHTEVLTARAADIRHELGLTLSAWHFESLLARLPRAEGLKLF